MSQMYERPADRGEPVDRTASRQARHRHGRLVNDCRLAIVNYLQLSPEHREALDWKGRVDYVYEQSEMRRTHVEHSVLQAREQIATMLLTRHGHADYAARMLADQAFRQIVGLA